MNICILSNRVNLRLYSKLSVINGSSREFIGVMLALIVNKIQNNTINLVNELKTLHNIKFIINTKASVCTEQYSLRVSDATNCNAATFCVVG